MGEFVVEGEFVAVEVELDGFHVPFGEELMDRPRFRVGEGDEGLLRSPQVERGFVPPHGLLEAVDVAVDIA